jgi:hypothetical protein
MYDGVIYIWHVLSVYVHLSANSIYIKKYQLSISIQKKNHGWGVLVFADWIAIARILPERKY